MRAWYEPAQSHAAQLLGTDQLSQGKAEDVCGGTHEAPQNKLARLTAAHAVRSTR